MCTRHCRSESGRDRLLSLLGDTVRSVKGRGHSTAVVFLATHAQAGARQVENCGVQVMQMDSIDDGFKTEFVSFTVGRVAFDAAVGQLHKKAVRVVISTGSVLAFAERHPSEFAVPDDQRFAQKSALFKIREWMNRTVRLPRLCVAPTARPPSEIFPAGSTQ